MKVIKRLLIYEMILIVLTGIVYFEFLYIIADVSGKSNQALPELINLQRSFIQANVVLDHQTLKVEEKINFVMPENEILLNIPARLYGDVKVNELSYQGCVIEMKNDNVTMHIIFPEAVSSIDLQYEIHLANQRKILSYHDDTVLITEFLITPTAYVNDKPVLSKKSAFGDPFVYPMQDYEITLQASTDYLVFAPGKVSESAFGEEKQYMFRALEIRDFPIALLKDPIVSQNKIRDVSVTYVNMPDVHAEVIKAFDYIEYKTGDYPYKELFVISAPIDLQGMEFSQMIFISDQILNNEKVLNKIIYHEIFHQWFYGIVGTNQMDEPFMDEGLVCYLTMDLIGDEIKKSFDHNLHHLDLTSYQSKNEYYLFAYNHAQAFYGSLSSKYGIQFDVLLKTIYKKYQGKILTYNDLMREVELMKNGDG